MTAVGPDTSPADAVLAVVMELALATGRRIVDPLDAEAACAGAGIGHDQWFAAVAELRAQGLVALQTAPPSQVVLLAATTAGIFRHLRATRPDLEAVRRRLADLVSEVERNRAVALADMLGEPPLLVECLLDIWVTQRRLVYSAAPGRRFRIHRVMLDAAQT